MDPRGWDAADWGAFGEVGAFVVAVVAGYLVWRQVKHASDIREDQTRPYVIVDFEFKGWAVLLTIRNVGTSPAQDVRFVFDPPLQVPHFSDPEELAIFADGVPMLAPGRVIPIPFGFGPHFYENLDAKDLPLRYAVKVKYSGPARRKPKTYDDNLVLDLTPFKYTEVEVDEMHQITQHLKEIRDTMKSWTSGGRLRIDTITHEEVVEAELQRRAQLRARQAKRTPKAEEE